MAWLEAWVAQLLDYPFSGISFGQVLFHFGVIVFHTFVFHTFVFDMACAQLSCRRAVRRRSRPPVTGRKGKGR